MADQTTNPTADQQTIITPADQNLTVSGTDTTTTTDTENGTRKSYATIEEANANKPANAKRVRLHRVTRPNGTVAFIWSANTVESMALVAREDGYTSSSAGTQVSADKVKGQFANLSDADKL